MFLDNKYGSDLGCPKSQYREIYMRNIILLIGFFTLCSANAAIIDFEDQGLAPNSQVNLSNGLTSGGFYFINGPEEACCEDLHLVNQNSIALGASTELVAHGDLLAMQVASGGSFSLLEFDLGSHFDESFTSLKVVGNYVGGGSVTQNFSIDGDTSTYDTISLSGAFNNLESANWLITGGNVATFYIDNISVSAIPIPAAVWLFGSALAGLGWIRRKTTT